MVLSGGNIEDRLVAIIIKRVREHLAIERFEKLRPPPHPRHSGQDEDELQTAHEHSPPPDLEVLVLPRLDRLSPPHGEYPPARR